MSPNEPISSSSVDAIVSKFFKLNPDLDAMQTVSRRVFFEFLRNSPTLSADEIDTIYSIADLLAELCVAKRSGE